MSPTIFHRIIRPLVLGILLLGCFGTLFLIYFKPTSSWLSHPTESAKTALKMKTEIVSAKRELSNQTIVLIWLWPFGQPYELISCSTHFNIDGCYLTADRNLYNKSDGVIIHHRDISGDLSNLPSLQRPPFQKWLWLNIESPANSRKVPGLETLFNLTMNYRKDSDIKVPYGSVVLNREEEDFVLPSKTKLVCWIVSNWNAGYIRSKFYEELHKHIEIHTYGQAFGEYVTDQNFFPTIASCKFYLSFENSIYKDYITEKLYNPLLMGTVPIVLGPSRQNYENFLPGDAFIHVDDFPSPKELAERILFLDKNEDIYLQYFHWRRYFKAKRSFLWAEPTCHACDYIRRNKEYSVSNNLDKWFWD